MGSRGGLRVDEINEKECDEGKVRVLLCTWENRKIISGMITRVSSSMTPGLVLRHAAQMLSFKSQIQLTDPVFGNR